MLPGYACCCWLLLCKLLPPKVLDSSSGQVENQVIWPLGFTKWSNNFPKFCFVLILIFVYAFLFLLARILQEFWTFPNSRAFFWNHLFLSSFKRKHYRSFSSIFTKVKKKKKCGGILQGNPFAFPWGKQILTIKLKLKGLKKKLKIIKWI